MPLRRAGERFEIAKHIAFLASDDSSFITETDLFDDGGMLYFCQSQLQTGHFSGITGTHHDDGKMHSNSANMLKKN